MFHFYNQCHFHYHPLTWKMKKINKRLWKKKVLLRQTPLMVFFKNILAPIFFLYLFNHLIIHVLHRISICIVLLWTVNKSIDCLELYNVCPKEQVLLDHLTEYDVIIGLICHWIVVSFAYRYCVAPCKRIYHWMRNFCSPFSSFARFRRFTNTI